MLNVSPMENAFVCKASSREEWLKYISMNGCLFTPITKLCVLLMTVVVFYFINNIDKAVCPEVVNIQSRVVFRKPYSTNLVKKQIQIGYTVAEYITASLLRAPYRHVFSFPSPRRFPLKCSFFDTRRLLLFSGRILICRFDLVASFPFPK